MKTLNREQAEVFAQMLEAGLPVREAVRVVAPDLAPDEVERAMEGWPLVDAVRDARIALNGGLSWLKMTQAERVAYTLRLAYNAMAYTLWQEPPSRALEPKELKRSLDFVDRLERHAAEQAAAAPTADGWTKFLQQVASDQRLAQALAAVPAKGDAVQ